jgi:UDP-N-acetylglucosamine 1-carboxyvinyltransferase
MSDFFTPDFIEINGGRPLADGAAVRISGAKNEVLGAMCAAILTDEEVSFSNVPHISDVADMREIMRQIGIETDYDPAAKTIRIHARRITSNILPGEALKFRASYYIWGAILARFAKTHEFNSLKIQIPGGCSFGGARAINYHTDLLKNMFGAGLAESGDRLEFVLPRRFDPSERPIYSTQQTSHGATFHWLLSAALSPALKFIYNASQEPEVPRLLETLNKMGANIRGTNTTAITNLGFSGHLLRGGAFEIMPDRMEAGFYALLAMALKSKIKLLGTDADSCRPWLNSVMEIAGAGRCEIGDGFMSFDFRGLPDFEGRAYIMSPIPGKETDMQQVWTPVLATAKSPSKIYDPVWAGRTGHLQEMAKFGIGTESRVVGVSNSVAPQAAEITVFPSKIKPADAAGMDLRGTAGLVICGAMAPGLSRIANPKFALRGYPNMVENLQKIGLDVRAV